MKRIKLNEETTKKFKEALDVFMLNPKKGNAMLEKIHDDMNYEEKYKNALERARHYYLTGKGEPVDFIKMIFPELAESEDERIKREIVAYINELADFKNEKIPTEWLDWLEKQKEPEDKGEISDGYHTFNELYRYRMLYNAAFFNMLPKEIVHKSKRHHDGKECFGGGWFIVMANLPTGQISNHYELKDWDLFQIPEKEIADEWDGHTPQEAAERLHKYLLEKQGEQTKERFTWKPSKEQIAALRWVLNNIPYNKHKEEISGLLGQLEVTKISDKELEPKFKVGDWLQYRYAEPFLVGEITEQGYCNGDSCLPFEWEDEIHLWTIQDAKDGDVIMTTKIRNCPFIYRKTDHNNNLAYYYAGVDGNGDFCEGCIKRTLYHFGSALNVAPATKEQRDLLFEKMKEAGYEWDAEKKELKKIEPKTLNANKVIEWLEDQACLGWIEDVEVHIFVDKFKKDFGL